MHAALQFIDYARCRTPEGVRDELERLRGEGRLSPSQLEAADPELILGFFRSKTGRRVLNADMVWRELRFSLLTDAAEFFAVPPGEQILLQGVVDCCILEDGALTVIDYKTDRVTAETIEARSREYAPQVRAYARAVERLLSLPVRECVLYFLRAGRAVSLPVEALEK